MLFPALLPLATIMLTDASAANDLPRRAPAQFVSTDYALTFRTPQSSTYCPLPADFVGSYHGPNLFLTSASRCSSAAGPRIAVGYGVWFSEAEVPRDPCNRVGSVKLMGAPRPLCRSEGAGTILFETSARYRQDAGKDKAYEVTVSLRTTPKRLNADLATFRATAASVRVCRSVVHPVYEDGSPAPTYVSGFGTACPRSAQFF